MGRNIDLKKVYPWVKQIGDLHEDDSSIHCVAIDGTEAEVILPCHKLMGDLGVFYVLDAGESTFEMVQSSMLPDEMEESTLFGLACDNLLRDVEFRLCGTNWGGLGIVCGGHFEAASLCCPDIWNFVAQQVQEDFLVAVPARDVVIMAPISDKDKVHNLKVSVNRILSDGDHTLSDKIFYYNVETGIFSVDEVQ